GDEPGEVGVELGDVAVPPPAVRDVVRPILILEHIRIDRLGAVVKLTDQRLAKVIDERPVGVSRAGDTDAADLAIALNVVRTEEDVVPAVLLDDRRRPEGATSPCDVPDVEGVGVLLPGDEISR